MGVYISKFFGLNALFLVDALSFIIAAGILFLNRSAIPLNAPQELINKTAFKIFQVLAEACRSFTDTITLNSKLKSKPSGFFAVALSIGIVFRSSVHLSMGSNFHFLPNTNSLKSWLALL